MADLEHDQFASEVASVVDGLVVAGFTVAASVPDAGLGPLLDALSRDTRIASVACSREDEAVATAAGAYLGGGRGVVLMQSSGLGNCGNVFASLVDYYKIPLLLLVSWRGTARDRIRAQIPFGSRALRFLDLFSFDVRMPKSIDELVADVDVGDGRRAIIATPGDWLSLLSAGRQGIVQ